VYTISFINTALFGTGKSASPQECMRLLGDESVGWRDGNCNDSPLEGRCERQRHGHQSWGNEYQLVSDSAIGFCDSRWKIKAGVDQKLFHPKCEPEVMLRLPRCQVGRVQERKHLLVLL
jgi:hypothetical protein